MDVGHDLCAVGAAVYTEPVAAFSNTFLAGHLAGGQDNFPHEQLIGIRKVIYRGYVSPGYDNIMYRRLGVDIADDYNFIVAKHYVRWYRTRGYSAKYAVHVSQRYAMRIVWQVVVRSMPAIL